MARKLQEGKEMKWAMRCHPFHSSTTRRKLFAQQKELVIPSHTLSPCCVFSKTHWEVTCNNATFEFSVSPRLYNCIDSKEPCLFKVDSSGYVEVGMLANPQPHFSEFKFNGRDLNNLLFSFSPLHEKRDDYYVRILKIFWL